MVQADREIVGDNLDVVNGSTVRVHRSQHSDLFELCDVPHEHHPVAVQCHSPIINCVDCTGYYVRKLGCLALLDLDFAISRHQVCRTEWRRLTQGEQVRQGVSVKDANDAIGAGAVESTLLGGAPERPRYLDVHPFQ